MVSGEGKTVCVTGASGYIATWLTKLLLERGYTVRATVRNLNDERKTDHLLALDGAKERLHLFEADLLIEGSFDSAIEGCQGVFHTASPCHFDCKDPQAELIDPAVKGTINVLNSCAKSSAVKRVVLTSSATTMLFNGRSLTPDTIADETWFSDPDFCIEAKLWHGLAKTLAEKEAWKFAKEKGIDMVTAHPALVVGPMLQPTLNFSSEVIASLINNNEGSYDDTTMVWIHVKDVADAHILLFENPLASGRYAMVESVVSFSEVVSMIHELYSTLRLPKKGGDGIFPNVPQTSKEKMKVLGMDSYIPFKVGLKETIESLKEKKFVTIETMTGLETIHNFTP